jgi:hypothetical protein
MSAFGGKADSIRDQPAAKSATLGIMNVRYRVADDRRAFARPPLRTILSQDLKDSRDCCGTSGPQLAAGDQK